jgi:hypothetical protein
MLALKAEYENGTVRWGQKPPPDGHYIVTVVFEEVGDAMPDSKNEPTGTSRKLMAMERLQSLCKDISPSTSLVDMLLAERRKEAADGWTDFNVELIRQRNAGFQLEGQK